MSKPSRIEPKVFFANESTFLSWLNISTLLASVGLGLMNLFPFNESARWAKLVGVILVPISISFLIYGLYTYWWRNKAMLAKSGGPYQIYAGPVIITFFFLLSVTLNLFFEAIEDGNETHGID